MSNILSGLTANMKNKSSAFTLIELLVVITIIAILASIALPVFNGVTERANQTKDLSNAKQIAIAMKLFASDNNGFYPSKAAAAGDYGAAPAGDAPSSNSAFFWLFPNYLASEDIFTVPTSKWTPSAPDNKIDPAGQARADTLKAGENTYSYVLNLTDTSNPQFPLIADGFKTAPTYDISKAQKGGVWAGKKAVVIFCDASGQVMKVDPASLTVNRPGSNPVTGLFASAAGWLDVTNVVKDPE
jgi:prepilin-type N-terminal cleavage/methylation domain-containing protein